VRGKDVQNIAQHICRRDFVPPLPGAKPRRRKFQQARKPQFAEQLFRRSFELRDVNGFRVFGDPGLPRHRSKGIAFIKEPETLF